MCNNLWINYIYTYIHIHTILPLALQPAVRFGLSNNNLPFFSIRHQLSPSSHSQHVKIFISSFTLFLGLPLRLDHSSSWVKIFLGILSSSILSRWPNQLILCPFIHFTNIYIYIFFINKTLCNLNRIAFKCKIYINLVSASNICLVLKKLCISQTIKPFVLHYFKYICKFYGIPYYKNAICTACTLF